MRELLDRAVAEQEEAEAKRRSPEAEAEREVSKTAFEDAGAAEAEAIVLDQHASVLSSAYEPFDLKPGERIADYAGDYRAVIDHPGERIDSVLESALPLRAENENGSNRPIDVTLEQTSAGSIEPRNPLVETQIGASANDGVSFADLGFTVQPVGAEDSRMEIVKGTAAFGANAYEDTDLIVVPEPTGVEVSAQIRSPDGPESLALAFDLPDDLHLEERQAPTSQREGLPERLKRDEAGHGPLQPDWAQIVRGEEPVASISPPQAWDAQGAEIPTSLDVDGDTVRLEIEHRGRGLGLPAHPRSDRPGLRLLARELRQ
jgi:hypothetical protein